jgi:large subunit ribosomal protein L1
MPTPVPPGTDIKPMVDRLRQSVKIRTKDRTTFHARVGSTEMDPNLIAENIDAVMKRIESVLEQGHLNIRSVYVKTTMGPAVRLV